MVDKTKTGLGIGMGIFVALSAFLVSYDLTDTENIYFCASRDLVGYCKKLSGGAGTRCYFNDSYKSCSEGWVPVESFIEVEPEMSEVVEVNANGKAYKCEVLDGFVTSYSKCFSDLGTEAYLGELI